MIEERILEKYGTEIISFVKGETLFEKNTTANYYFQIISGGVKMNFYNENGNEFIQGIFGKNKSFGEPPLLIDVTYPANAIAISDGKAFRLKKESFKTMLLENSNVHYNFSKLISKRLYYKATIANGITSNSAEEAILALFKYLKFDVYENNNPFEVKIDLTRKNIAGLLGLSVESTIRTIKKMETKKLVQIKNKKIYF